VERTADEEEPDPWFEELKEWSHIKLRILEKYADTYRNIRGSSNSLFYYVDGFAGAGYYIKNGELQGEGSPVRLARLAQQIKDTNKAYRAVCIFSEIDRHRCNRLESALEAFSPELVHVLCGDFRERVEDIVAMMSRAPAVVFLDPFGVEGISPKELQPLLERLDTELLINFNTRALHRLKGSATSNAREAPGKVHRLSEILAEDPAAPEPEWQRQDRLLSTSEWETWVVDRYKSLLLGPGSQLKYARSYPVRATHKGGVKYYLVFASRSLRAFSAMTDFVCSEEDELSFKEELAARAPGQRSFFDPIHESERADRSKGIIEEIYRYGLANQNCTTAQIIDQFSYRYFGRFKQKHFRSLVGELVREGRAEIGGDTSTPKDRCPIRFK